MNKYLVITADDSQCYVSLGKRALPTLQDCWEYIEYDLKNYMDNLFNDAIDKHEDVEVGCENIYWSENGCFAQNADFQCEYEIVDMEKEMEGEN